MKEEIGRQPSRPGRIDAAPLVAKSKIPGCWLAVVVQHFDPYVDARLTVEQQIHFIAKPQVLCSLTHVEHQPRFALSHIPAEQLNDAIFDFQTREPLDHRRAIVHVHVKPTACEFARRDFIARLGIVLAVVHLGGIGAVAAEPSGHTRFVVNLDQEHPPALLHELPRRSARPGFHATLWIDIHTNQAKRVQHLLDPLDTVGRIRTFQSNL